jgi:hypothetical protein
MAGPDELAQYAAKGNPLPPDLAQFAAKGASETTPTETAPDRFTQDRQITEAWGQNHPILGPIARFLVAGGQNAANAITETPGQIYHAIADPGTLDEAGLTPSQRLTYRMGGKQAIEAGTDYASGRVTPKAAASVLPEALGTGVGQVAGGAVYGKGGEVGTDLSRAAIAKLPSFGAIAGAPIRYGARAAEAVANSKLRPFTKIMTPADEALASKVQIPGRDFGLRKPVASASILDATGENKPFAGGMDEYAPKPATILDATGENRPFAGGFDEYASPATAPAKAPGTAGSMAQSILSPIERAPVEQAPVPKPAPATEAPATPRTRAGLLNQLRQNAARIQQQEKAAQAAVPGEEDLTPQLEESLRQVRARKAAAKTVQ